MSVAVSSKFTKDTVVYNGLDAIEKDLIEEGLNGAPTTHYAVVAFEVTNIDIDVKSGKRQPRVNLKNIEVMHGDKATEVKAMIDAEFRYRNGRMDAPGDTLFDGEPTPRAIEGPAAPEGSGTVDGEGPGTEWPVVDGKPAEAAGDGTTADAGTSGGGEDGDASTGKSRARKTAAAKATAE